MKTYRITLTGENIPFSKGSVVVYHGGEAGRVFPTEEFSFGGSFLLTFDENGRIYEIGNDLRTNPDSRLSSPQLGLPVPAGGFALAFDANCDLLMQAYQAAMADGVIYCSTMSMPFELFPLTAEYLPGKNAVKISCPETRGPKEGDVSFLAVGNSHTYFNGTPLKFMALCQAAGKSHYVEYCTRGAAKLSEFADEQHPWGQLLREKLSARAYDYVVLQDYSATSKSELESALQVILPLVEANGAKPLFYISLFAESATKERIKEVRAFSLSLANKYHLPVASGNHAFDACRQALPETDLWADDRAHQSKEGSYLAACHWLQAFVGIDPCGNSYTAGLEKKLAEKLQQIAKESALSARKDLELISKTENIL